MTALQALHERVEQLTEDEAAEWLARIDWESTEMETLTEAEMEEVLAGEREIAAGNCVDGETFLRELGL